MQVKIGVLVLILCTVAQVSLFAPRAEAAMPCDQVRVKLAQCLGFLQGRQLAPQCCPAVQSVAASAKSVLDRRATCRCLVETAKSVPGINFGNAAELPGKCGVSIPFPIRAAADCSRVG